MGIFEILIVAVGLAMDAFAVSLATSVKLHPVSRRQVFRFAFHFGLFQALMPVVGWLAGRSVVDVVGVFDHWIAFGLLGYIGGKAIWGALRGADDEEARDPTRGTSLIITSIATSIDALAVGLSLGVLRVSIWLPVAVIGVVTALLSTFGMLVGSRLGARFGKRMEIVGGLVLIAIGVKILVEHLTG